MTTLGKEPGLSSQTRSQAAWPLVRKYLETGQYEQVIELLQAVQSTNRQIEDELSNDLLMAAEQICLVAMQCRAQVEWHRQAAQEAERRAQDLGRQLWAMLTLVNGQKIPALPPEAIAPSQSGIDASPVRGPFKVNSKPEKPTSPSLKVYCLGSFRVYDDDQLITNWCGLKARSIFKYMIAHQGAPIAKDILMDVFWPEADPEAARRNLHQAIYSLRQTLKQVHPDFQPVQFENDCYLLNPELDIWLDYVEFEKHIQAGQSLEAAGDRAAAEVEYKQAIEFYQGDFLEEDLYEDWPMLQREYLRSMYLDMADRLSEYYAQQGNYTAATVICQKILAHDNCHEEAHRRLMQCYLAQDQRRLAARQYQSCVQTLKAELGVPPAPETQALYRQIVEERDLNPAVLQSLSI
jgi:DNA-binding SARP family transcriptional activator